MQLTVHNLDHQPYTIHSVSQMWRLLRRFRDSYQAGEAPCINAKQFPKTIQKFIAGGYHFLLQENDGTKLMVISFKQSASGKILFSITYDAKKQKKGQKIGGSASKFTKMTQSAQEDGFQIFRRMKEYGTLDNFCKVALKMED